MLYNLIPGKQSYLEKVQNVKQGDYLLFKDEPYKILKGQVKMSSHGICAYFKVEHAFSKQILEDKFHSNGYLEIPVIQFEEYNLVGINDDDFLSLLKSNGTIREDLKMPIYKELSNKIKMWFEDGKVIIVQIMKYLDKEEVFDARCDE
ncbi:unnamed protein product [Paramecium primaurelia]|uniref:Translation initiation factor 5A C-terminal domain-containing protein n=1 Tax=Paramecium primaurelia TaxID=5886 RepID=A0A8S1L175_PARPR|nr:unnamed protein product [Paramecium primaurelia]